MKRYITINPIEPFYQSRIKDHLILAKCMTILFEFFQKNEIASSIDSISSYNSLLKTIVESKVTNFNYDPHTNVYSLWISPKNLISKDSAYLFLFGNGIMSNNYLLVELNKDNSSSLIKISLECGEKYLPFTSKYDYEIDSSRIMSLDEFTTFLQKNKRPGRLRVLEVP